MQSILISVGQDVPSDDDWLMVVYETRYERPTAPTAYMSFAA